jgi:hypothetical protein
VAYVRQLLKLVVDVDDGAVLLPVIADNHGLLHRAQIRVVGKDALLHCEWSTRWWNEVSQQHPMPLKRGSVMLLCA